MSATLFLVTKTILLIEAILSCHHSKETTITCNMDCRVVAHLDLYLDMQECMVRVEVMESNGYICSWFITSEALNGALVIELELFDTTTKPKSWHD